MEKKSKNNFFFVFFNINCLYENDKVELMPKSKYYI